MGGCASHGEVAARVKARSELDRQNHESVKQRLAELDGRTRVPHLLIEVRSLGFVEIQGKNTGGIYEKLDAWLTSTWGAQRTTADLAPKVSDEQLYGCCGHREELVLGPLEEHNRLCDASYTLGRLSASGEVLRGATPVYRSHGCEGETNMGKLTMQLVQFMTNECGWTFQVCDAGNLGWLGDIREQQLKFKAPHPLNLVAPHLMVELRQVGFVEVNGPDMRGVHHRLSEFLATKWQATGVAANPAYCDLKFRTGAFKSRGTEGENNMGLRTMELVDFMVKECQWTMVCCNGGNHGLRGTEREQQLVFRKDEFVQHGLDHIMVELRASTRGYVEINGLHSAPDLRAPLESFLKERWGCGDYAPHLFESGEKYCDVKYWTWYFQQDELRNNLGKCTVELAEFMGQHGWALLLCNGGSITKKGDDHGQPNKMIIREQQIKFTRAKTPERAAAPLLLLELRTDPTSYKPADWLGFIEVCGKSTNGVHEQLDEFIKTQMLGEEISADSFCDRRWGSRVFRMKASNADENSVGDGLLNGESNIGQWTMRICDFLVDHLGEWDLLVCNSDNLRKSWKVCCGAAGVTAREMQLVFRHRPGGRCVFMSAEGGKPLGRAPRQPPKYWTFPACLAGEVAHQMAASTEEERAWMQQLLDATFKSKATRDRRPGEELADRFAVVQVLRSEHPELWDRYALRRQWLSESCQARGVLGEFLEPKTMQVEGLRQRCVHATVGNPANQAYLLHGTNPTSAVAILERSFAVSLAGKSVGTMFGPGIYLAESSTKADEYAADDVGGEYDGLYAMLVCRVVLGRPLVVEQPGDYSGQVVYGDYDHVIGDREKAAGTFREFVLFHEGSIYPEYAVFYRREKGGRILPPPKRAEAPAQEPLMI